MHGCMRRAQPFGPLQFAALSAGVLTALLTCVLIIAPADAWWAFAFPRELAMYRLEHASNYFDFGGCPYAPAESWQYIRAQPNAAELFDSVAVQAQTGAGRVMGVAGLMAAGTQSRASRHESHEIRTDSIAFLWAWDRKEIVPLARALKPPLIDSVLALMQRPLPDYEC